MKQICPIPRVWNEIHTRLVEYSKQVVCNPSMPPVPLILGGWAYSNDQEKMNRWQATIDWANKNGCSKLIKINDEDYYWTENVTNYVIGALGGPMYQAWNNDPKQKPSVDLLEDKIKELNKRWSNIVDAGLNKITSPVAFTGIKGRRLIIKADYNIKPPWGSWTELSINKNERRTFTKFRESINKAIFPHEVDHIEFIKQ
jgi:hypothetical protein